MGDAPRRSTPAGEFPGQDGVAGDYASPTPNESRAEYSQSHLPPDAQQHFQQQQFPQQYGVNQQHAFASQFDATQPMGSGRPGPYNMAAMVNALPQAHYGRGQFNAGNQRYNPGGAPANPTGQMQHGSQYAPGQVPLGGLPNQQYYLPQHGHVQQYYGATMAPSQQPGNLSPRTAMNFYSGQMAMNNQQGHPQAGYYYSQGGHFPGQSQTMPPQMVAGQYLSSTPPQSDPRLARHHGGEPGSRSSLVPAHDPG